MSFAYNPTPNPLPTSMGGTGTSIGPIAPSSAIGSLPSAASVSGQVRIVTDALAPVFGAIVAAGGAVTVAVWSNGSNWIIV